MPDRIRLDGRVAVVTGAAGVIGTATIRLLSRTRRPYRRRSTARRRTSMAPRIKDLPGLRRSVRSDG